MLSSRSFPERTSTGLILRRGNLVCRFHVVAQQIVFDGSDHRAFLGFDPGIPTGDDAEAIDQVDVGAKIGDTVSHVKIEPCDHAHHQHQGGHRQDDAEQGEKAAQLVRAQSIQRKAQCLHHGDDAFAKPARATVRHCGGFAATGTLVSPSNGATPKGAPFPTLSSLRLGSPL